MYVPFCKTHSTDENYFATVFGYYSISLQSEPVYSTTYLLILTGIIGIAILASLFMYSSRKAQIRLSIFALFLIGLLILVLVNFPGTIEKELPGKSNNIEFSFGLALPFLSILFLMLAIRSIRKDEKLVKSADRLR